MLPTIIPKLLAPLLCLQFVAVSTAWSAAPDSVVIHNKNLDLTSEAVKTEFELQPDDIKQKLKKNELALRKFVDAVNNELLFEREAQNANLKDDPAVAKKIEIAIRKTLIAELIARKTASIKVPNMEALALAEFKAHPEKYVAEESTNVRHILLTVNEKNRKEQEALLKQIKDKVIAGESFAELAKKYSEDKGSAAKGGEIGVFGRGKTVKPFEDAAFALKKPNQLSDMVESGFGLHLIQLIEYFPPQKQNFAAIKDGLIATMKEDYLKNAINHWRDSIIDLKNAELKAPVLEKLIADIKQMP